MSKVLRLHSGSNTITDWGVSSNYDSHVIQQIQDPNNSTSKREITSIPSPFARMDLTKNAFREIVKRGGNLKGNSIYHKLVSDSLDVGQIFFEIDKLRDKVEIFVWDKTKQIKELLSSNQSEHNVLGETLKLFLNQDASIYNFDVLQRIYILNYIGLDKPSRVNIIGATSPATLFFTPANNLEYVSKHISFGNDRPFDGDFQPLYLRNFDYQKFLYLLQKTISDFSLRFPEVSGYLDASYVFLDHDKKCQIDALSIMDLSLFDDLTVNGPTNYIEVIGNRLMKMKNMSSKIESNSDFVILSGLDIQSPKPLVLPVDTYNKTATYIDGQWDSNTKVKITDKKPILERSLPVDGTIYPYLTIGDFLEDTIIKTPYQFNSNNFVSGNYNDDSASYLLPLKKLYFDYFPVSSISGELNDGKKVFEIEKKAADCIKVTLRIPIKNNEYITYERLYIPNFAVNETDNKGSIIEKDFAFAIYPNIKVTDATQKSFFRVTLIDRESLTDGSNNNYILHFYNNRELIKNTFSNNRNRYSDKRLINSEKLDSVTYAIDSDFELIELSNKSLSAFIIPKFNSRAGTNQITFAIDFGTTNTHIEYSINGRPPIPFSIDKDCQIHKLHKTYNDAQIEYVFDEDIIPEKIGKNYRYNFPITTVLSEQINTDWDLPVVPMVHTNIPFMYGKRAMSSYNKHITGLKWSSGQVDQSRVKHFIESLFMLIRNKVLLNNGDLGKTKIVWFFPASMTSIRYDDFKSKWEELYKKYFGDDLTNLVSISESVAPYNFHKNVDGAAADVVSIDIGGGTTDVLIVENGKLNLLTSFRFAANSIFGDGYSYNSSSNGFVRKYKEEITKKLQANSLLELQEVLKSLDNNKISADTVAFFFSLSSNKDINDRNIKIDFNEMLRNDDKLKYLFILFYTAIIYHIAIIMKEKGLKQPRHLTFSGTGSKVLSILTPSDITLAEFTKFIFEKIYNQTYPVDGLTIIRNENPKEATCKGGVLNPVCQNFEATEKLKSILLGSDKKNFIVSNIKYNDILNNYVSNISNEVNDFVDFTFDLNTSFSFNKKFGANISIIDIIKAECKKDIEAYLKEGINKRKEEIQKTGADDSVEESLFFFPLVGVLNALSRNA